MDYSENYQCIYQDEPSAVFFDRQLITVHPMVVHYKTEDKIAHKSFIGVTDSTSHSAPTTLAFMTKFIPLLQEFIPNLQIIHYITDSPSNQYRNKSIIKAVSHHPSYFQGIQATWDYLEAGHGKGPADGLGSTIKRQAELAVKRGIVIRNSEDFTSWATKEERNMHVFNITPEEIQEAEKKLQNAAFVKGVSTAHSLRPFHNKIYMLETSCYEKCCRLNLNVNKVHGWKETSVNICNQPFVQVPTVETGSSVRRSTRQSTVATAKLNISHKSTVPEVSGGVSTGSQMTYKLLQFVEILLKKKTCLGK